MRNPRRYSPKEVGTIKKSVTLWPDAGREVQRLAEEEGITFSGMIHRLIRTHPRIKPFLNQ